MTTALSMRRPIGETLYTIYLVSLVLGIAGILSVEEAGPYGQASQGARAAAVLFSAHRCSLARLQAPRSHCARSDDRCAVSPGRLSGHPNATVDASAGVV